MLFAERKKKNKDCSMPNKIKATQEKRKAGRPKVIVDWKLVNQYLEAGCTGTEVAARLGMHPDSLYNTCKRDNKTDFSAYSQSKRASGDALLRAKQFETAMGLRKPNGDIVKEPNTTMLVWLGKNRLDQSDKTQLDGDINMKNIGETNVIISPESLAEAVRILGTIGIGQQAIAEHCTEDEPIHNENPGT
jgi:hypothetical protein